MASPEWTIRPYEPGDEKGILELFNGVFREGNPQFVDRTLEQWRWTFDHPNFDHQTWVALAKDTGRIIGQYTAIPMNLYIRGRKCLAAQAVDTCIDKAYRRSLKREGLFLTLAREWFEHWGREERNWVVYGFPNEQAFPVGTRVLHYRPVHCPIPKWQVESEEFLAQHGELPPGLKIETLSGFDAETDALYESLAPSLGISTWRDADYQNWRFVRHPNHRYSLLGARRDGRLVGYLVFRHGWLDETITPLVDILVDPEDKDALKAMLIGAAKAARESSFPTLEAWMSNGFATAQHLKSFGFDPKPGRFNLCIRIFNAYFGLKDADRSWYYTMADSDIY